MSYTLSPFDPILHLAAAHRLWQHVMDDRWSITAPDFESILMAAFEAGDHQVAHVEGQLVGLAASQIRSVPGDSVLRGEVMAIVVSPEHRRHGIGREMLAGCVERLRSKGCGVVQLGGGGRTYFWPGVPTSLEGAWDFFAACGWHEEERSFDLLGELSECTTPALVTERLGDVGVVVGAARAEDHAGLRRLLETHFPAWAGSYVERMATSSAEDIVVARSPDGDVIGMSCAEMPPDSCRWERLKANTGSVGALGVHPDWREKGVGLAIAAKVTERLRERGVQRCFVGWTWLVDWYGGLGYAVWEEYVMSREERIL